jgi:hypothetical protein
MKKIIGFVFASFLKGIIDSVMSGMKFDSKLNQSTQGHASHHSPKSHSKHNHHDKSHEFAIPLNTGRTKRYIY